jgi:hypothetical protein
LADERECHVNIEPEALSVTALDAFDLGASQWRQSDAE